MNQRRFVVEIARPVPAGDVEQAATYVARRLGMEEARIRTLLSGRTGPVTRDVLADKADAIAKVFSEAGVMVTVVERAVLDRAAADAPAATPEEAANLEPGTSAAEPPADYEYGGPPEPLAGTRGWDVNDSWHNDEKVGDDPGDVTSVEPSQAAGRTEGQAAAGDGPGAERRHSDATASADLRRYLTDEDYPGAVDLRLPSTRWVPSPHDNAEDPVSHGPRAEEPSAPEAPGHASSDAFGNAYPDDFADDPKVDFDDDVAGHGGLWLAPEPSPFDEGGALPYGGLDPTPRDHPRLRTYLLWALLVSIALLGILQLVFSARGASAAGATYEAGLAPYRSGDFRAARTAWQGAAEKGDPRAQYMLGYLVQNGLGQPWSNRRAAEWYRLAAANGVPEAQTALANLYLEGLGVQPDAERGVALLREAAAAGHPPALYQYAELLFHGRWVDQDFDAALAAFTAAAAGGSAEAADFVGLARHLESGRAAPQPLAQD